MEKANLTITADNKSKTYGNANPALAMSYTLLGTDTTINLPEISCTATAQSAVGDYDITLAYAEDHGNTNYNITLIKGTLTIGKAPLTVKADDKSVSYLDGIPTYTVSYSGLAAGDNPSALGSKYYISVNMTEGTEYEISADYGQNCQFNVARFTATIPHSGGAPIVNPMTLTVTETSSKALENTNLITADADMSKAFSNSVEVRITDVQASSDSIFSLTGTDGIVYPFDISLYDVASRQKVQPNAGYKVTITLPLPAALWDSRENVCVVYVNNGQLVTLASTLLFKNNVWCIVFEAEHFSPYALVVVNAETEFIDVLPTDWFHDAVTYVNRLGLMSGTSATTFEPQTNTSRGMIVTILHRLEGKTAAKTPGTFRDVADGQ